MSISAQDEPPVNYDESAIPDYTLPDPLVMEGGIKIDTARAWNQQRRVQIWNLFQSQVYGAAPGRPPEMSWRILDQMDDALDGRAVRKVVRIEFVKKPGAPYMGLHIYLPKNAAGPVPVFVGFHLFDKSAAVPMPGSPVVPKERRIPEEIDPKMMPGEETIYRILERGYAIATINPEDIAPDDARSYMDGVMKLYLPEGRSTRNPDEWGALAVWAWGLSRALDYFESDKDFDANKVIAIGHSRRGKTALWAGATDTRFAAVISNESGCGGAALSRRAYGETVAMINKRFPHWFADNFKKYNDKENELPVDQHMLLALIAPRPVYIGSAVGDRWADPQGEFLSAVHADPVYQLLLGKPGLGVTELPPLNTPVGETIGYHIRSGTHALSDFDWMLYLDWCDRVVMAK